MTPQEFQSILPCYFGQKVYNTMNQRSYHFIAWIPNDSNGEWGTLYTRDAFDNVCWHTTSINWLKLILRKMEDMTEEENEKLDITAEGCITIQGFNYLRSIGVDTDNLIEAGWAIHQKEVQL